MNPQISVLMSVYKEPIDWIKNSVASILTQSFDNFEFIIVCDNPSYKEAIDYIKDIKDTRIKLLLNPDNIGLTKSLNIALAKARGQYVARMDADDISLPNRFLAQKNFLDKYIDIDICVTDVDIIDAEGKLIIYNNYKFIQGVEYFFIDNPIAHSSVMFRKSLCYLREPLYNEKYITSQDFELWSYCLLNDVQFGFLDKSYLLYRRSDNQISRKNKINQLNSSENAHKKLAYGYLRKFNVEISTDKYILLNNLRREIQNQTNNLCLYFILYELYVSLAIENPLFVWRCLLDPCRPVKHWPKRMLFRLLFLSIFPNRWYILNYFK